jgi:hypothetical protein
VLFTGPAERPLRDILGRSEAAFGALGRRRYETLVEQALMDLVEDPERPARAGLNGCFGWKTDIRRPGATGYVVNRRRPSLFR